MDDIHDVALALLARRAHTLAELRRKLLQKRFDPEAIEAECGRLAALRFVGDEDLAYNFARRRAEEGRRGPARVRAELLARGIDPETAGAAVRAAFSPEDGAAALAAALRRLVASGVRDPARLARRLVRAGFPRSGVVALLEQEGLGVDRLAADTGDDDDAVE